MKKLMSLVALALMPVLGVLFTTSVFADSPGQLSNAPTNYKVRNVTKNGTYAQSVSATCNETVKYSIMLANSDYGLLKNLTVKADMPSGAINASATNVNGATTSVSGNAKVNLDQGTLKYVSGSTVRISEDQTQTTNVADGITTGGVNVGDLNGSTLVYVQFQAKVSCPETPKYIKVCELATKKIITINEKDFDASKHSKNLADCAKEGEIVVCDYTTKTVVTIKESDFDSSKHTKDLSKCETPVTPPELPQTGSTSGAVVAIVAALLTAAAAYVVTSRKNVLG